MTKSKSKSKSKEGPQKLIRKDGSITYSWGADPLGPSKRAEPFQPGNTKALRTGHRSERTIVPIANELTKGLLDERPDLTAYPETLAAWSRAEARVLLLSRGDFLDEEGAVINARDIAAFERQAMELRHRLGLDPRSEADLHRSRAEAARSVVDLEAIRQRGREALAHRSEGA